MEGVLIIENGELKIENEKSKEFRSVGFVGGDLKSVNLKLENEYSNRLLVIVPDVPWGL